MKSKYWYISIIAKIMIDNELNSFKYWLYFI